MPYIAKTWLTDETTIQYLHITILTRFTLDRITIREEIVVQVKLFLDTKN